MKRVITACLALVFAFSALCITYAEGIEGVVNEETKWQETVSGIVEPVVSEVEEFTLADENVYTEICQAEADGEIIDEEVYETYTSEEDFMVSAPASTDAKYANRTWIEVSGYLGGDLIKAAQKLKLRDYRDDYTWEDSSGNEYFEYERNRFFSIQEDPTRGADGITFHEARVDSMEKYSWTVNCISDYYDFSEEEFIDFSAYPSLHFYGVYCGQSISEAKASLNAKGWKLLDTDEYSHVYAGSKGKRVTLYNVYNDDRVYGVSLFTAKGWESYNQSKSFEELQKGKAAPTKVSLNYTGTITVKKGSLKELTPKVQPSGAARLLSWKSSNTQAADVTQWGLLNAKKPGIATITVTSKNGKKATLKVKVVDPAGKGVPVLNVTKKTLKKGGTLTLKVTMMADGGKIPKLTWTSSNKKVAKVNSKGKVTAVGKGTATITVKAANGKKAKCKVTVKAQNTVGKTVDIINLIGSDIREVKKSVPLTLSDGKESWLDDYNQWPEYYNLTYSGEGITLDVWDRNLNLSGKPDPYIDDIFLTAKSKGHYHANGVSIGMNIGEAAALLRSKGWEASVYDYDEIRCEAYKTIKGDNAYLYLIANSDRSINHISIQR